MRKMITAYDFWKIVEVAKSEKEISLTVATTAMHITFIVLNLFNCVPRLS